MRIRTKVMLLIAGVFVVCTGVFTADRMVNTVVQWLPSNQQTALAVRYMPAKFWLHRVNSPTKQLEFSEKYAGIEMDAVFREPENHYENSHDLESLTKWPLEKQFEIYGRIGRHRGIWLDIKNLTSENADTALAELNRLVEVAVRESEPPPPLSRNQSVINGENSTKEELPLEVRALRSQIWVESSCPEVLGRFRTSGYRTSFYLPIGRKQGLTEKERISLKNRIETGVVSGYIDAVSFNGDNYRLVESLQLPKTVKYLTWLDRFSWVRVKMLWWRYRWAMTDSRVEVVLVQDKGIAHR